MQIVLRPYQNDVISSIRNAYAKGINKQVAVLAVGMGKTVIFSQLVSSLVKNSGKKALILAHRGELLIQAKNKLEIIDPTLKVSIEMGDEWANQNANVVLASVQTLGKDGSERIKRFNPSEYGIIIVDECQHCTNTNVTYRNILDYFGVLKNFNDINKNILLLGVTATPSRTDNNGIDSVFDKVVFEYPIVPAIKDGWLSHIKAYRINTDTDISYIKKTAGDFNLGELGEAVNTANRNSLVIKAYKEHTPNQQALCFAVNVKHAIELSKQFNEAGISSDYVIGTSKNRAEILEKFSKQKIKVVVNCMVLCLDTETEILTRDGWKNYQTMDASDLVANYHLNNGKIEFIKPQEIIIRDLYPTERMVSIQSPKHNIRVTDTHKMIYQNGDKFSKKSASELVAKRFIYPTAGEYKSENQGIVSTPLIKDKKKFISYTSYNYRKRNNLSIDQANIKALEIYNIKQSLVYKQPSELNDLDLQFIGFWIGDGNSNYLTNGGIEYCLHQDKREKAGVVLINDMLDGLNISYLLKETEKVLTWHLSRGTGGINQSKVGIYRYEKYLNKDLVDIFWSLNRKQIISLVKGLWLANGNHTNQFIFSGSGTIYSANKKLMNNLQALLVCKNITTSLTIQENPARQSSGIIYKKNTMFRLYFNINKNKRGITSLDKKLRLKIEDWQQTKVWCVKTDTKNIITRRNGRICIMGNTEGFDEPSITAVLMARPTQSGILMCQMIGRGTRLYPGKEFVTIIDFVDNTIKNTIQTTASLLGMKGALDFKGRDILEVQEKVDKLLELAPNADLSMLDIDKIQYAIEEVDLMSGLQVPDEIVQFTRLDWYRFDEDVYRIGLANNKSMILQKNLTGQYLLTEHEYDKTTRIVTDKPIGIWDELQDAISSADQYISKVHSDSMVLVRSNARWRREKLSDQQIGLLTKFRVNQAIIEQLDKGQGSRLISRLINSSKKWGRR